eukprot:gene27221-biopygen17756
MESHGSRSREPCDSITPHLG